MTRLRKALCCVGLSAALVVAGVGLVYAHPDGTVSRFVFLPEICAAGLAAMLFCFRAKEAAGRERTFWSLWAAGCALWIVGILLGLPAWPRSLHSEMRLLAMVFTFLPEVAMMAALVVRPELLNGRLRDPVVRYEVVLVALWWVYLYLLFIAPWRWIAPSSHGLLSSYIGLHYFQDFTLVLWLVGLASECHGRWRRVYAHMACAMAMLTVTIGPLDQAIGGRHWPTAIVLDSLIAASFLWLALTSLITRSPKTNRPFPEPLPAAASARGSLLVPVTVLGFPVLMLWSHFLSRAPESVSRFRLLVSFAVLIAGVLLVYRWQDVADENRENMVGELETSVRELRRLQGQFAEAEKLASLGQLAAGAAHEINNPVAAMLGYAELLHADPEASPRVREMGRKIGDQARRIRSLVHNLLSLGEHASFKEQPVDIATLVRGAVDLRRLDVRHRHANLIVQIDQSPLEVRGDPEKLLQVFYRLLLDLSGDEGGNAVDIRARRESRGSSVIVEFSERAVPSAGVSSAPKLYDAHQAQQGGGLSLGVCYAIVQEHHGSIAHENLVDGRRLFRVSLPSIEREAVPAESPAAAPEAPEAPHFSLRQVVEPRLDR